MPDSAWAGPLPSGQATNSRPLASTASLTWRAVVGSMVETSIQMAPGRESSRFSWYTLVTVSGNGRLVITRS